MIKVFARSGWFCPCPPLKTFFMPFSPHSSSWIYVNSNFSCFFLTSWPWNIRVLSIPLSIWLTLANPWSLNLIWNPLLSLPQWIVSTSRHRPPTLSVAWAQVWIIQLFVIICLFCMFPNQLEGPRGQVPCWVLIFFCP